MSSEEALAILLKEEPTSEIEHMIKSYFLANLERKLFLKIHSAEVEKVQISENCHLLQEKRLGEFEGVFLVKRADTNRKPKGQGSILELPKE